jgi:uncharacterized membrane protein YqjE
MPDRPGEGQGRGLAARARQLLEVLVTMFQSRFELASLELREELVRWMGVVLLAAAAFFFGQLGLLLLTLAFVALFPEHAALALAVAAGLYLAATVICIVAVRQRLKDRPPPFADSVAELKKDREWLSSLN